MKRIRLGSESKFCSCNTVCREDTRVKAQINSLRGIDCASRKGECGAFTKLLW